MTQAALLGVVAGLGGYVLLTVVLDTPARAQSSAAPQAQQQGPPPGPPPFGSGGFGGPGGRGGPFGQERKIVAQFDKNNDKRLDSDERTAAREWLETQGGGFRGFGGRRGGGPGGRGFAAASPGPPMTPADVKAFPSAPLYDIGTLRTIFLQFENADWEKELAAFHNTDVEVPATAIVDGKTYKDVGVHFRGASSYMMVREGSKRSLNLSFDFVDEKQEIGGYRTLNLLNANGDPTFVRAVIYAEIAQQYLAAPKANYMRVVINGESWGIYINAEQFNKDFTRDYFKSTKGARWKVPGSPGGRGGMEYLGEDAAAYKTLYEIKTKDDPKAWADLIKLFRVLNQTPADKLEAALAPILDVDGVLRFLALEVALVNSDGYWARASDYSIYQDEKGRFHVIPHDMNEGLADEGGGRGFPPPGFEGMRGMPGPPPGAPGAGGPPQGGQPQGGPPQGGPPPDVFVGGPRGGGRGMFGRATAELDPLIGLDDPSKPLRSKLLAVPALREKYLGYVREIATKYLDWNTLGPRVAKYQALIAAD
ncbi:MAG TPA: CotH kinase family protein, partial [Vicinamibacterales bacterium]|nr:CotH kinase family protein [Vicinamibacterales bacterium]